MNSEIRKKRWFNIPAIVIMLTVIFITFPTIAPGFIFFGLALFLLLTASRSGLYNLLFAIIIALSWSYFAREQYGYNKDILTFYGMSSFPAFAWASGLLANHMLYLKAEHKLNHRIKKHLVFRISAFSLFYIMVLLTMETVAYYVFDIKNIATSIYPGLPICNCLHAPRWMQGFYLLIGPIFFAISLIWDCGDPYNTKKKPPK